MPSKCQERVCVMVELRRASAHYSPREPERRPSQGQVLTGNLESEYPCKTRGSAAVMPPVCIPGER